MYPTKALWTHFHIPVQDSYFCYGCMCECIIQVTGHMYVVPCRPLYPTLTTKPPSAKSAHSGPSCSLPTMHPVFIMIFFF